jgi:hypothetical protein
MANQKRSASKSFFSSMQFAVSACYNKRAKRVEIVFNTGIVVAFRPEIVQGLDGATVKQLSNIVVTPSGSGLYFPDIDADVLIPALLQGVTGTASWMASRMGAIGGKTKTARKAATSRENGKLGGRPRKKALPSRDDHQAKRAA